MEIFFLYIKRKNIYKKNKTHRSLVGVKKIYF